MRACVHVQACVRTCDEAASGSRGGERHGLGSCCVVMAELAAADGGSMPGSVTVGASSCASSGACRSFTSGWYTAGIANSSSSPEAAVRGTLVMTGHPNSACGSGITLRRRCCCC